MGIVMAVRLGTLANLVVYFEFVIRDCKLGLHIKLMISELFSCTFRADLFDFI